MPKYRQDELKTIERAYSIGRELADAGLLEDAITHFDEVLGHLPRRRRDRVYRIGPAVRRLPGQDVLWLPPVFRDALLAKAYCLNELGHFADAFPLLERAVELDPDNPLVYAEIGFAHGTQENTALARAAYLHAAELEPSNPAHPRALAHLALVSEDFAQARDLALNTLAMEPDSVPSLHQLAYAEYRLGNLEVATRTLQRAVELAPDDQESTLRLAGTLREMGRIRDAITCLHAFIARDPLNPEVLGLMTDLLQQDGTTPELIPHAERLLARNPNDPTAYDLLAWGFYQQGEPRKSLDALRRLVALEPTQPYHHFKLGMLCQSLGHLPLAMASLLRAMALDADGEVGQMAAEAISSLDQVQVEQLLARAELDLGFRHRLRHDPERTLQQSGYLLSPLGFQLLQSLGLGTGAEEPLDRRARTVH